MATAEEYAAWIIKNAAKRGTPEFDTVARAYADARAQPRAPVAVQPEATGLDRVNAVATGVTRGAGTRLIGLPVDTVTNVLDLAKAGVGFATSKVTGSAPPDWTAPYDRTQVAGSGDWIERKIRDNGAGALIDPSGPVDETTRVLHNVGMGAGGAVAGGRLTGLPMTGPAIARTAVSGGSSGAAGAIATEMGASPEVAILASMSPQISSRGIVAGTKAAVRGGEQGRQAMEQRMLDLKEAGIENPSLGLASGNHFLTGLENIMSKIPGSGGLYADHRAKLIEGMMNKSAATRDLASTQYGSESAGRAIQSNLQTLLRPRITDAFDRVNEQMSLNIPSDKRFPIPNALTALSQATSVNPLAPATTGSFVQPRIAALRDNILADTQGTTPSVYGARTVNNGLPVNATRQIRSSIGKEAASRAISGTPEQAEFKQVYGGLTKDIGNAARMSDIEAGPQPNNIGPAERSFNRGNKLYSAGMARIDRVQPFASKDAPEQSYNALMQTGKENVSTMRAVKKSVSEETRAKVAATAIDRMGRARPGQQDDEGGVWSQETFLTNWNQLTPTARMELFSGFKNAAQVTAQINAVAKGASMVRDSSKVWANPSGTGGNMMAAGTLGGIIANAFVNPLTSAGAVAGLGAARLGSQNMLLNPKFVQAMAKPRGNYNALADLFPLIQNAQQTREGR